jgi:hypothetical protein
VVTDGSLFRGGWFDSRSIMWKDIEEGNVPNDPVKENTPGRAFMCLLNLIRVKKDHSGPVFAWYVPHSNIRRGSGPDDKNVEEIMKDCDGEDGCCPESYTSLFYEPWYSSRFENIFGVTAFWREQYDPLRKGVQISAKLFMTRPCPRK